MYLQYLCKVVSCELPPVCVCHLGLLLGDFICHGRCPYTTTPRGEIRHAAWLSLPLPIYHCFSALFKCPALLPLSSRQHSPLSLAISVSVLHLILSTSPLLPPFPPVRSTEPWLWTGYRSRDRGSTRIRHAGRRRASVSIQQDCWQLIAWKSAADFNLFLPLKLTGQPVK